MQLGLPDFDRLEFLNHLSNLPEADDAWRTLVDQIGQALDDQIRVEAFADRLELSDGVSGYVYHTVPVVIYAALRHAHDPATAIEAIIRCGGDTDTPAAIAGGILGAARGTEAFPAHWRDPIHNGPISLDLLARSATALANGNPPPKWSWLLVPCRNLWFLLVVLGHGFRRLIPS